MTPMSRDTSYRPNTVAQAFEQIKTGSDPWITIGDFLDGWHAATGQQQSLVAASIIVAGEEPALLRWAAFFAAMVEELCLEAGLAVPGWVNQPEYVLADPWYLYRGKRPEWRAWQEATSPEPFKKRNIFGGDRVLARA